MTEYQAPWYLHNSIMMWVWANGLRCVRKPKYRKPFQQVQSPAGTDGSFFNLAWSLAKPGAPRKRVVLFAPGLSGGAYSKPTRGMVRALNDEDWDVAVWVFRDTAKKQPTAVKRTYSGHDLDDIGTAVQQLDSYAEIALVGLSLGGAGVLQFAARCKNPKVTKVVAISPPIDFGACVQAWSRGLMGRLVISPLSKRDMRRKARAKRKQPNPPIEADDVKAYRKVRTVVGADQFVNTRFNEDRFAGASDYWYKASTTRDLWSGEFNAKTLIIIARDDFLLTARSYPLEGQLPKNVDLHLTRHGSHLGFVPKGRKRRYWSEARTVEHLSR